MLDAGARLWVELLPAQGLTLLTGDGSRLSLRAGEREKVLKEFAHTQGQLAYSSWQLGSEMGGTRGAGLFQLPQDHDLRRLQRDPAQHSRQGRAGVLIGWGSPLPVFTGRGSG